MAQHKNGRGILSESPYHVSNGSARQAQRNITYGKALNLSQGLFAGHQPERRQFIVIPCGQTLDFPFFGSKQAAHRNRIARVRRVAQVLDPLPASPAQEITLEVPVL
jgi:hypothetical protein